MDSNPQSELRGNTRSLGNVHLGFQSSPTQRQSEPPSGNSHENRDPLAQSEPGLRAVPRCQVRHLQEGGGRGKASGAALDTQLQARNLRFPLSRRPAGFGSGIRASGGSGRARPGWP